MRPPGVAGAASRHDTAAEGGDRGQFAMLLAIVFLAPLPLGSNRTWACALLGGSILVLLLYHLLTASAEAPSEVKRRPWRRAALPLLALAAWVGVIAVQATPLPAAWTPAAGSAPFEAASPWTYLSIDPYSTRVHLLKALAMLALFALLLRLATSPKRVELLVQTIVLAGCVQAVLGIVLFALGAHYSVFFVDIDHRRGAAGTYVNHNHFAGFLEMALAAGIGLMIAKMDNRRARTWREWASGWLGALVSDKAQLRLMLIVMVIALIASRSRMGNAAFFVSLLAAGLVALVSSSRTPRSVLMLLASLIVLDVVLIGSFVGLDRVMERIQNTRLVELHAEPDPAAGLVAGQTPRGVPAPSGEESLEQRIQAAKSALGIVRDRPVLGAGGGTFHLAFVPYRPAELHGYFDHAHNDFVELAAETGAIGFALLAIVVGSSLFQAVRILAARRNRLARGMAFATTMGVAALLLHGAVDFNLQIPANLTTFIALLALPYLVGSRPARMELAGGKE